MRFKLILNSQDKNGILPFNYQYPLSAAIYKILAKGNAEYADFLHEKGYGKGYKFFTFSDLKFKFKRVGDRMSLLAPKVELIVCFHLPEASKTFVEGLFKSEEIVIADQKSKAVFGVQSIISLDNPLNIYKSNEVIQIMTKPTSTLVTGKKRADGKYEFFSPDQEGFEESLIYNWERKIAAAWDVETSEKSILMLEIEKYKHPFRSRLITIKAGTKEETQIRGFLNFKLKLTAERRFVDLLLNAGAGLYTAQGMGCLEVVYDDCEKYLVHPLIL